ncbi:Lar family restriction alleviation protein [Marinibactrum halimedae]|uniref:Lar family restriction alleviation protein n=1 Tax=Marinibactrum halimedae TaxID=1444977 RepID=UPI0039F68E12
MATSLEPCPFCQSSHLHICNHLMTYSVSCQSCRCRGPHRSNLKAAQSEWNKTSLLIRQHQTKNPIPANEADSISLTNRAASQ